ncbi:MAG: hypothetical protein AAGA77_01710 [Bacteroidota bacterium]
MDKKGIITIILGTLILFIWGIISWMVLPFHGNSLNSIPEGAMDTQELKKLMPESGVYHLPGMPADNSEAAMKKVEDQLAEGPRITLMVYKNEPTQLFDPKDFITSLLLNLLTALFTFLLISKLGYKDLKSIMMACLLIALLMAVVADLSVMNWFMFPFDFTFANIIDRIVSFGLLGLLFAFYTFKGEPAA